MDENEDIKIREFITKDKKIPTKINKTFDNFIYEVQNDLIEEKTKFEEIPNSKQYKEKNKISFIYKIKRLGAVAASLCVVTVGANVYARTQGYENIFFMIKDLTTKMSTSSAEIFEDKDIIISYKYFSVTDNVEMQINELQVKENKAKLFLLVKENEINEDTPFTYKVLDKENNTLYNAKSKKIGSEKIYTETLELSNYKDSIEELKLEIYNKENILIKVVNINLKENTIEARTENSVVKKISQIQLNKFLKEETAKLYSKTELKNKEIIILKIYDIYYSQGKYVAKYIFMMPTEEEIENDKAEESTIYSNSIEFTEKNEEFKTIKSEKVEIFEKF